MFDKSPFFSVISVTFNSSKFVRKTIESILASSFKDFELIIADDSSVDNTWEIISEYNDCRIVKYCNETNLGEYRNRNKALRLARGQWVVFIDGDDLIYKHGLSYLNFCITQYCDLTINMILQRGYYENVIFPVVFSPKNIINNFFFGRNAILGGSFSSLVIRNETIKKLGYLREEYITGDDEIRYRMAALYPTLVINGFTSWARETPNAASSSISDCLRCVEINKQFRFIFQNYSTDIHSNDIDVEKITLQLNRQLFKKLVKAIVRLSISDLRKYFSVLESSMLMDFFTLKIFFLNENDPLKKFTPVEPYDWDYKNKY